MRILYILSGMFITMLIYFLYKFISISITNEPIITSNKIILISILYLLQFLPLLLFMLFASMISLSMFAKISVIFMTSSIMIYIMLSLAFKKAQYGSINLTSKIDGVFRVIDGEITNYGVYVHIRDCLLNIFICAVSFYIARKMLNIFKPVQCNRRPYQ